MPPNWKSLVPHRPVQPGDPLYIERPDVGGRRIADMVRSGQSTILVAGPLGIGKSTELAHAARVLQGDRVACLVQLGLERTENMRRVTSDQVLLAIAGRLAFLAIRVLGLDLSADLREGLVSQGALPPEFRTASVGTIIGTAAAFAQATIKEVSRLSRQKLVTLLIDGLEKTPEEPARLVFDALAALADGTEIVVVVPWHAAYGPNAQEVVRPGEKLVVLRPVEVEGEAGTPGRAFLAEILAERLSLPTDVFDERMPMTQRVALRKSGVRLPPDSMPDVVAAAAKWSGGIPRTFLQLVADAASYAQLDRGAEWPEWPDIDSAVRDQVESTRRLLLPGDEEALGKVDGTDGRELDLARKLRLLQNGLLIESEVHGGTVLRMHPFVRPLVAGGRDA